MNTAPRDIVDNEEFENIVANSDAKVTLVDFHAAWCGPCKMLSPVVEEIAQRHSDKLNVVKVDADELAQITAKYGVRGIPTLMIFKDGVPVATKVGAASIKQVEAFVSEFL